MLAGVREHLSARADAERKYDAGPLMGVAQPNKVPWRGSSIWKRSKGEVPDKQHDYRRHLVYDLAIGKVVSMKVSIDVHAATEAVSM